MAQPSAVESYASVATVWLRSVTVSLYRLGMRLSLFPKPSRFDMTNLLGLQLRVS